MRAHLFRTSMIPALALFALGCSPSGESASSEAASPQASAPAAPAPAAPAPVQTAEAAPAAPAPAPAAAPAPSTEAPAPAQAAAAEPSDEQKQAQAAIELRQAPMKLLGWNMGPVRPILQGSAPFDAAVIEASMTRIAGIAPMIPALFEKDVHAEGIETKALPRVWTNKSDFDALVPQLVEAASKAAAAAKSGDEAATKAALGGVGRACGACHDDFRAK